MRNSQPKIFIAYSANDRNYAEMLAKRLYAEGLDVWLDRETLDLDLVISSNILKYLESCSTCLLLVNNYSYKTLKEFDSSKPVTAHSSVDSDVDTPLAGESSFNALITELEQRSYRNEIQIIPISLPDLSHKELNYLPAFMQSLQWFEFQQLMEDKANFKQLLDGIYTQSTTSNQTVTGKGSANIPFQAKAIGVVKKTIRLPDIDWVEIPAGPFIYGEGETQQTIDLPSFYISRYPVTNCQYQCFIDAEGYKDERWWKNLIKPKFKQSNWTQANRPKETVDWYEAVAFTRWLSKQLNYEITLPTEQQWEKAARGADGREYPWGNDFKTGDANVYDSSAGDDNLRQTSAVGLYPHRPSPYGVEDMAGNVWEWCLNKYNEPKQIKPDNSGNNRVLRGGSLNDYPDFARSTYRLRNSTFYRNNDGGFRMVCLSPL